MIRVAGDDAGGVAVRTGAYRLEVAGSGYVATLSSPAGEHWASLRPLGAFDCVDGRDETLGVEGPRVVDGPAPEIVVERTSTRWEHASAALVCHPDHVEVRTSVHGRGDLTDVRLLAGRVLSTTEAGGFAPGGAGAGGLLPSGFSFRTLFSPNPEDPDELVRPASARAVIGVSGDGQMGRGHWFFTPAPLCLALTTAVPDAPTAVPEGWVGLWLAASISDLTFVELAYEPSDRGFVLRLDYEGHTAVDGEFEAPTVVVVPGLADPYAALRRHRDDLGARGAVAPRHVRDAPAWWTRPLFCGWGAQSHLARVTGDSPAALATQVHYDGFLDHLEQHGVVPSTIVIDAKWQETYAGCEPDRRKWPDFAGWIAARHARGQRVLLWWKAWDPEGLPEALCIRRPDGAAVAVDPTNPAARAALRRAVTAMLAPDGIDADGLKIDFTSFTPTGMGLSAQGPTWGIALLHELLGTVYAAAKAAKPDALVVTHTPNPAFVDVTDMIRLNDMLRLDYPGPMPDVVRQMRYRAAVARAVCPELLIDTDDWCAPDLARWREYLQAKVELGVPALYYATHVDVTGEPFEPADYAAIRAAWSRAARAAAPRA